MGRPMMPSKRTYHIFWMIQGPLSGQWTHSSSAPAMHCMWIDYSTRTLLTYKVSMAYRAGVAIATSSLAKPFYLGGSETHIISGLSTTFRTGAAHAMQRGA